MIGRILLFNVDLPLAEVFKRKLEDDGFKVTFASSSDILSDFDLVISGQPQHQFGKDTPMIILSREDTSPDTWQLKFPFRPSELLDLIHQRLALAQAHTKAMCTF